MNIREICAVARSEIDALMDQPWLDPNAPPGYLTRGYVIAETRQRFEAAREILELTLTTIDSRYGPVAGAAAREHLAPMLWLLAGNEIH